MAVSGLHRLLLLLVGLLVLVLLLVVVGLLLRLLRRRSVRRRLRGLPAVPRRPPGARSTLVAKERVHALVQNL